MSTCPERFNFARFIIDTNAARADKTAYIDDADSLTYGQLAHKVAQFAGLLHTLGIRREERILLVMHDTCDWPVVFLGALYAGVVPVAVNTLLPARDYAWMLAHSRSRAVFVSPALLPVLREAMEGGPHEVQHLVVAGGEGHQTPSPLPENTHALESLLAAAQSVPAADTLGDEIAFWLYSSGSTGHPKGVVHTHANLWQTFERYGKPVLGLRETDVVFSAAKLFFAYGLGNALTFALSAGATVVLMAERPTPAAVFKRLMDNRPGCQPTVFCGVPTLYASMMAASDLPAQAQLALRVCASAGEALPQDLGERFTRHFGCWILDGIGSTEMLHIFISNREGDVRYGTTGKPVPGYEIELRDEQGKPVPSGSIGDLYIRGQSAALLYWNNRAKTRQTFLGDWVKSGDKYVCDEHGYYTYAGRSDDMIKVSGQYVSPVEVENVLVQHSAVLEAAVIGVKDDEGLTKTAAYVVLCSGHAASPGLKSDLQDFVKTRLTPVKYPRSIHFVQDLPKTATGKIQRFRLREQAQREPGLREQAQREPQHA